MGYTTEFTGVLKFSPEVTLAEVREVTEWLHCDSREVEPDVKHEWYYMDFELANDMGGIQWDGSEKFYGAVEAVNWLVNKVREKFPKFTLNGTLEAQGEDAKDLWLLVVTDGIAKTVEKKINGKWVKCPYCDEEFVVGENNE